MSNATNPIDPLRQLFQVLPDAPPPGTPAQGAAPPLDPWTSWPAIHQAASAALRPPISPALPPNLTALLEAWDSHLAVEITTSPHWQQLRTELRACREKLQQWSPDLRNAEDELQELDRSIQDLLWQSSDRVAELVLSGSRPLRDQPSAAERRQALLRMVLWLEGQG